MSDRSVASIRYVVSLYAAVATTCTHDAHPRPPPRTHATTRTHDSHTLTRLTHVQEAFRFIFREAKIQNAIVFFDECEPLFESRDRQTGTSAVNVALTEVEKFSGTIVCATNRPEIIDAAMMRRITLAVEFPPPSHVLRAKIFKLHVPTGVRFADDVDFDALALEFELNGGFIKNAMLQALSLAVARIADDDGLCNGSGNGSCRTRPIDDGTARGTIHESKLTKHNYTRGAFATDVEREEEESRRIETLLTRVVVTLADIRRACKLQIRSALSTVATEFESVTTESADGDAKGDVSSNRRGASGVTPSRGIDSLVVSSVTRDELNDLVVFEKARKVLTTAWGFGAGGRSSGGGSVPSDTGAYEDAISSCCVFVGTEGVGKARAASAIGETLGRPTHTFDCATLLRKKTEKLSQIFQDAKHSGAIVLIRSAGDSLLNPDSWGEGARSSSSSSSSSPGTLRTQIAALSFAVRRYPGLVILLRRVGEEEEEGIRGAYEIETLRRRYEERLPSALRDLRVVYFARPNATQRESLWHRLIPTKCPLSNALTGGSDGNGTAASLKRLATTYVGFSARDIKRAILDASARAALRSDPRRVVEWSDLTWAADRVLKRRARRRRVEDAARAMFN